MRTSLDWDAERIGLLEYDSLTKQWPRKNSFACHFVFFSVTAFAAGCGCRPGIGTFREACSTLAIGAVKSMGRPVMSAAMPCRMKIVVSCTQQAPCEISYRQDKNGLAAFIRPENCG